MASLVKQPSLFPILLVNFIGTLGFSKITAFANPDQIVIGQLVYESLDKGQKSIFRELSITNSWNPLID